MTWDKYFLYICESISSKSPCLSRQIGAIIVRENSIVSTGYNGPARGFPHCDSIECPRRTMGFQSGEGLDHCPATHAEANCIANAARLGVSVRGASLYMSTQCPCKECMGLIVNAGLSEVIVTDLRPYHRLSLDIAQYGKVRIRRFEI
jgi:dCMP deaminase